MVNNKKFWMGLSYNLLFFILLLLFFKNASINRLFYKRGVYLTILILFLFVFGILMFKVSKKALNLKHKTGNLGQFLLIPVVAAPLFKCRFKMPYVFCSVCPAKCPFGQMQNIILSSAVLMNLESRTWCSNLCPVGKVQDSLNLVGRSLKIKQINPDKNKKISLILNAMGYIFLTFFLLAFFSLLIIPQKLEFITRIFLTPSYSVKLGSVIIGILVLFSMVIPRFWCNHFCPVGLIWRMLKRCCSVKKFTK